MKKINAGILGVGAAVPDRVLTNADLERMVDTSDEWIRTRTGIRERRIAPEDMATADLAEQAARRALTSAGVAPDAIDMIVVATVTPDMAFPSTACLVQERLGSLNAGAFDLSAGCSGFVYALDVATRMIESGVYRHILVIGADLLSRVTDFTDRSTCVLFGDGAGAVVMGPVKGAGVMASYLGADGRGGSKLYIPSDGPAQPLGEVAASCVQNGDGRGTIRMEGNEVFKFAVRIMGEAALEALRRAELDPEDVDLFIPHQANIRIIDAAAKRLNLPAEKVFVNVDKYGNTSAASIPIALNEAYEEGRIAAGDRLVLVGFGAGLTWAAAVLEWAEEVGAPA